MVDPIRLKKSWSQVAAYGDQVPLFFYSYLFLHHPYTREMFPVSMARLAMPITVVDPWECSVTPKP